MKGTPVILLLWPIRRPGNLFLQVSTPAFSFSLRPSREREDRRLREESLVLLLERLDRRLRSSPLFRACRYFRCIRARRRRRFVNKIPVNITNDANSSNPPATYLSFVSHVCLPDPELLREKTSPPEFELAISCRVSAAALSRHIPLIMEVQG